MPKLSKNDRLAYNIGRVTLKYNDVQFSFFLIFQSLMHDALYLAHPTFFAVKSDRGQRDMLRHLAGERLKEHPEFLKQLAIFIERANQLGGRRNDVLHAMWNYALPRAAPSVRLPFHNRLMGKNADEAINALFSDLCSLEDELWPFCKMVKDSLQAASKLATRKMVAEALIKGLRPPDRDQTAKAKRRQSGRKSG